MAALGRMARRNVVVILGATGTGKSKLALQMAKEFRGEILSADSMQVYKGLDIITNKVTREEMSQCVHHMIGYVDPLNFKHTVVDFRNKALPIIDDIISRDRIPVIVGGTNYYIEALLWQMLINTETPGPKPALEGTESTPSGNDRKQNFLSQSKPSDASTVASVPPLDSSGEDRSDHLLAAREDTSTVLDDSKTRDKRSRLTTAQLYAELEKADLASAKRIHPNDRRKIFRALEVLEQQGRPLSELLAVQHEAASTTAPEERAELVPGGNDEETAGSGSATGDGIRGPLRFEFTTVLWIQCDQEVLDRRTDDRVDQMIEAGLIEELTDFHRRYNEERLRENKEPDYTSGIFQTIGFKEFHTYLLLTPEERQTSLGQALFKAGVEEMKRVTRRYARKQRTWINNRFLKRRGSALPRVYAVNSTFPDRWQQDAYAPAVEVLSAVIDGRVPAVKALPCEENTNVPVYNRCDICDMVFVRSQEWKAHLKGRRHRNKLKKRKRVGSTGESQHRQTKQKTDTDE